MISRHAPWIELPQTQCASAQFMPSGKSWQSQFMPEGQFIGERCKTLPIMLQWMPKARAFYVEDPIRLPRQPFSQVTDSKLCHLIPRFATVLPQLYYSHTTFENNHILPPTWHEITQPPTIRSAAAFICSTYWNWLYSLPNTFFCQDFFPHCGQRIYLVLPICGAKLTALYVGTYLCPHSLHA